MLKDNMLVVNCTEPVASRVELRDVDVARCARYWRHNVVEVSRAWRHRVDAADDVAGRLARLLESVAALAVRRVELLAAAAAAARTGLDDDDLNEAIYMKIYHSLPCIQNVQLKKCNNSIRCKDLS